MQNVCTCKRRAAAGKNDAKLLSGIKLTSDQKGN